MSGLIIATAAAVQRKKLIILFLLTFHYLVTFKRWITGYRGLSMKFRRKDSKPYPPDTLTQITAGLQRFLRNEKSIRELF